MTISTATLTPSTTPVLGVGAVAEHHNHHTHHVAASSPMLDRVGPGYQWWLAHVMPAAGCSNPVRLKVHADWGDGPEPVSADMPDGVLYVACKNRRASVCPGCAATYRADMYQLIKAGLLGGKGVPASVVDHPCLFVTFTAPSFGAVHSAGKPSKPRMCMPRRDAVICPHGTELACWGTHDHDDDIVGEPLCLDCYDYEHQAVWNLHTGELWRRTTITINRQLASMAKSLGAKVRLQYAKVAEYQRRGAIHYHALIRLDGYDPDDKDAILPPHPGVSAEHITSAITDAARSVGFQTPGHPHRREGWPITWGRQLDIRTVRLAPADLDDSGQITTSAVAGYLAKYATKATEDTGYTTSRRLTTESARLLADGHLAGTHQARQVLTCWYLGQLPGTRTTTRERDDWAALWGKLARWAHMLGFGGHFATKSRRYSTTLTALREVRRAYQRGEQPTQPDHQPRDTDQAGDTAQVVITYTLDGVGWLTIGDAQLANTAAAKAREHRRTAREEIESSW